MDSPSVPLPPKGYAIDAKPPAGYNVDTSAPLSPDLEDRRTSTTIGSKINHWENFTGQVWNQIKSDASDPSPLDPSFYNPLSDAYSQTVAPQLQTQKPLQNKNSNPVLQQILTENPGLAKTFNTDNTSVVFAQGDRAKRGLKERGGLEYWSPSDGGTKDFPSPSPGKHVLEIYSDDLKNNPKALKTALYGDLMHGMSGDSYWNNLRTQFMQSFTPQELKRQEQRKTWWDDVNGSKDKNGPTYDAYIRGWIANEGDGKKGQVQSGNTMYSPKQIEILQKMQKYVRTGRAE